jgi:RecA-family ATPase
MVTVVQNPPDIDDAKNEEMLFKPTSFSRLLAKNPSLRPYVIGGVLRKGEILNIIADSKAGKSWMSGGLAWSVVTGTNWLTHDVTQGRVLIIDNELHDETLAFRLDAIRHAMMINGEVYGDRLDIVPLRGKSLDIHTLNHRLAAIEKDYYSLVILDALYRFIPEGTSENDNAKMMAIYNKLDYYADILGSSIAVIHHASKGNQSDKKITDVGAGAGSINRATDSVFTIRQHEDPALSVLECKARSSADPVKISIRFDFPVWTAVAATAELKTTSNRVTSAEGDKNTKAEILESLRTGKPVRQQELLMQLSCGQPKALRHLNQMATKDKTVKRITKRKRGGKQVAVFWQALTEALTKESA